MAFPSTLARSLLVYSEKDATRSLVTSQVEGNRAEFSSSWCFKILRNHAYRLGTLSIWPAYIVDELREGSLRKITDFIGRAKDAAIFGKLQLEIPFYDVISETDQLLSIGGLQAYT